MREHAIYTNVRLLVEQDEGSCKGILTHRHKLNRGGRGERRHRRAERDWAILCVLGRMVADLGSTREVEIFCLVTSDLTLEDNCMEGDCGLTRLVVEECEHSWGG